MHGWKHCLHSLADLKQSSPTASLLTMTSLQFLFVVGVQPSGCHGIIGLDCGQLSLAASSTEPTYIDGRRKWALTTQNVAGKHCNVIGMEWDGAANPCLLLLTSGAFVHQHWFKWVSQQLAVTGNTHFICQCQDALAYKSSFGMKI